MNDGSIWGIKGSGLITTPKVDVSQQRRQRSGPGGLRVVLPKASP